MVADERGTLSKPSDEADHSGFQLPHSVTGWALIGHKVIVLYRTDRSTPSPQQIRKYYTCRFPRYRIEDRYELTHTLVWLIAQRSSGTLRRKSAFSSTISQIGEAMNSSVMFGGGITPQGTAPSKGMPARRVPVIQRVTAPQVKLFMRCDAATWLFAELDYDGVAFDPFDPVHAPDEK